MKPGYLFLLDDSLLPKLIVQNINTHLAAGRLSELEIHWL
jgi:hypothetical protein